MLADCQCVAGLSPPNREIILFHLESNHGKTQERLYCQRYRKEVNKCLIKKPPRSLQVRADFPVGGGYKSLAFSTGPWRRKLLGCLSVLLPGMALVSAFLTRVGFTCSPGLATIPEVHSGRMETRGLQAGHWRP